MSRLRAAFTLAVVTVCLVPSVNAQTLAEAAKKAAAAREKAKPSEAKVGTASRPEPPPKVYTNQDLPAVTDPPADPPSDAEPKAAVAPATSTAVVAPTDSEEKGEAYWRARALPFQKRIAENGIKLSELQQRIDRLTDTVLNIGPLNTRRGGVESERQRLISEAEDVNRALRLDQAQFSALEEEGRRAGALPGWFR